MRSRSRRKFLQDGSTAVASGVLVSPFSRTVRASTGERIQVGIIGRTGKGDYGHQVDIAFTKMPNVEIVALADEDEGGRAAAQARYAFASGAYGHFASRRGMAGSPTRFAIQVFGSKGIIEMESGYLKKGYILRDSRWSPGRSGKTWEPITSAGVGKSETRTDGSYEGGHIAAINDLIDSVKHDRPTKCSAKDCRAFIEMISAVFESHRVGGPIELPMATRVNALTLMT